MKKSATIYAVTIAAVAIAAFVRWLLDPLLKDGAPFATFLVAVIFSAWFAGLRAATFATFLGFFAAVVLIIQPQSQGSNFSVPALSRFGMYFMICGAIAIFAEAMRVAQRRSLQAEQNAQEQAETLRITLASIGDAVITTDAGGRINYMNAVAESLTGWRVEDAVTNPLATVFNIISEQSREVAENPVDKVLLNGRVIGLANHTVLISRNGTERPIEDSAAPIRDTHGRVVGAVLVFHDDSSRRKSEADLHKELSDTRSLHELVSRLLVCPDLQSALDEVLDATITLMGAELGNLQLENPVTGKFEIVAQYGFTGEFLDNFRGASFTDTSAAGRCLQSGKRIVIEDVESEATYGPYRKLAAIAGYRAVQSTPLLGRNGEPLGILSTHFHKPHKPTERKLRFLDLYARQAADFIERTKNDAALRDSETRYRAIGEAIDFGVWMCNAKGKNNYCSDSFLRLIGITQEQYSEFGWGDALHPDECESAIAAWQECVKSEGLWDREHRFMGIDGQWHHILARGVPIKSDAGQVLGWVGINLDISRLKSAEDSLRRADRHKDEFLATLAHELRNPLAPVRNAIQVLTLKGPETPEFQAARVVIDRQIQQMTRLIDDLLDISRVSLNKLELRKDLVELKSVIESAVEASRPSIEEFGHQFTVVVPDEQLVLDADLTRLSQVFLNLLTNAAKYTDRGGRIELHAERQEDDVVITVKDNGIGIPPQKLPFLFQMFSQIENSLSRSQGGLGIGLALVRRLVEMHGGVIEAHSEGLGQGSQFTVRLPLTLESLPTPTSNVDSDLAIPTSQLRILVVDDNQDAANTLTMLLKIMGNQVHTVHDGEAAVKAAEQYQPNVVLLDIGLPKMNGYEAARCIRKQAWSKDAILIAVTGWGQDEDKRRSADAGFDKHLVKPVDPSSLMKIIAGLRVVKL